MPSHPPKDKMKVGRLVFVGAIVLGCLVAARICLVMTPDSHNEEIAFVLLAAFISIGAR